MPFSYRVLLSADPQLCASLISDGFDEDDPDQRTPLWAVCGDFDGGRTRLEKLLSALSLLAAGRTSALQRLGRRLGWIAAPASPALPELARAIDDTRTFLDAHRDRCVLLETVELHLMTAEDAATLRELAEQELARCRLAGAAIDALPDAPADAARALAEAAAGPAADALSALRGLRLDRFDHTHDGSTEAPLGLSFWSEVLYFGLWNRAEYEAHLASSGPR